MLTRDWVLQHGMKFYSSPDLFLCDLLLVRLVVNCSNTVLV